MSSSVQFSKAIYSSFEQNAAYSPKQIILTLTRSGDLNGPAQVALNLAQATATAGTDYHSPVSFPETVFFAPGETSKAIVIDILDDTMREGTEYLNFAITSQDPNTTIGQQGTTTLEILDSETSYIEFAQTSYTVEEGSNSPRLLTVTLMRTGESGFSEVELQLNGGSATPGQDYRILDAYGNPTPTPPYISFQPGETTKTIQIEIAPDFQLEGTESINLGLVNRSNEYTAIGRQSNATVTILDAQTPYVEFAQATYIATEGTTSPNRIAITLTRKGDLYAPANVDLQAVGGSATNGQDYYLPFANLPEQIVFNPGETTKTIWVDLLPDGMPEGTENIQFQITGRNGTSVGTQNSTALQILDQQSSYVEFAQTDYWVEEGSNYEMKRITIALTRQGDLNQFSEVRLLVNGGSAQRGSDYDIYDYNGGYSGGSMDPLAPISFNPGERTKTIQLEVRSDFQREGTESLTLELVNSPTGGQTLVGPKNTSTIQILDNQAPYVEFSQAHYSVFEGSTPNQIALTLVRKGNIHEFATVKVQVAGGNATQGIDYYSPLFQGPSTVDFAPGEASKTIRIDINPDGQPEGLETAQFELVGLYGTATGKQNTTTLQLFDRDRSVIEFSQAAYTITEGQNNSRQIAITITRQGNLSQGVGVNLSTNGGTAQQGMDYQVLHSGGFPLNLPYPIYFNPGETSKTIVVDVKSDFNVEGTEFAQFQLTAMEPQQTIIGPKGTTSLAIQDAQSTYVGFAQAEYIAFEGDSPTQTAITITRQGDIHRSAEAQVQVVGGSASFMDYSSPLMSGPTPIYFAPGEAQKTVLVYVNPDQQIEGDETLQLELTGLNNTLVTLQDTTTLNIIDRRNNNQPPYQSTIEFAQADYTVDETAEAGTGAPKTLTITLVRHGNLDYASFVELLLNGGSAEHNLDYQILDEQGNPRPIPVMVQFSAGESRKTIQVAVNPDPAIEGTEFFKLQLINAYDSQTVIGSRNTTTVHILDHEIPYVEFAQAAYVVEEGMGAPQPTTLTLTRKGNLSYSSTVKILVNGGSAAQGEDYITAPVFSQPIVFNPGETTKTVSLDVFPDGQLEGTETARFELVSLESPTTIGPRSTTTLQIVDQQSTYVEFEQTSYLVEEASFDTPQPQPLEIKLTRRGDLNQGSEVQLLLNGGSAQAEMDYIVTDAQGNNSYSPAFISFAPGESSKTIKLYALSDSMPEGTESVQFQLVGGNPQTAIGINNVTTVNITDPDPKPNFALNGAPTVLEDTPYQLQIQDMNVEQGEVYTIDWGDGSALEQYPEGAPITPHVYTQSGSYTISVKAQDDDGDIVTQSLNVQVDPLNPPPANTVQNDFNNDGTADILWHHIEGYTRIALTNNQGQIAQENQLGQRPANWKVAAADDFNGDGTADILWHHTEGYTRIALINNQGQIIQENQLGQRPANWKVAAADDFNGDGTADILWHHTEGYTRIALTNTQGQIAQENQLGQRPANWKVAAADDFNGDGTADILWHHTEGYTRIALTNTQGQIAQENQLGQRPANWKVAAADDFNGDGTADILWHHTEGYTRIALTNNQGQITQENQLGQRAGWQVADTDDFNGDGTTDILWRHTNGYTQATLTNNQGNVLNEVALGYRAPAWQIVATNT